MHEFFLDGESSRWYGLVISGPSSYDAPERDVEFISVPGRSGDLVMDKGRYKNIVVRYEVWVKDNLPLRTGALKSWLLRTTGYRRLEDTYDTRYFRKAVFSGPVNWETTLNRVGSATLEFNCAPYRYSKEGEESVLFTSPFSITNEEAFSSLPYLKVHGNGAGTLYFNNQSIQLLDIDGYVELDSETKNASKGQQNKNNTVNLAEYPALLPGENTVSWSGGVIAIDLIPRWCTL